jgi:hypothetical protein
VAVAATLAAGCGGGSGQADTATAPPVTPDGVVFRGDFESGDLSGWRLNDGDGLQIGGGEGRLRVVTSPRRQGRYAGRFEVREGDVWRGAPGERTQACFDEFADEGQLRTYRWSTRFAEDYPSYTGGFQLWSQWHAKLSGPSQAPIQFIAAGDEIGVNVVESDADARPTGTHRLWRGPMRRGRWQDFTLRVQWSSDPDKASLDLRVDGAEVMSRRGIATLIPGHPNYVCQGLYRSDGAGATAVVFYDGLVITQPETT